MNTANLVNIIPELFRENLVRGRGLFSRAVMKAQMASPTFTHVYAALVAVVNTKMPENGELIVKRVVVAFRRAFKRNDKIVAVGVVKFIAHLVNYQCVLPFPCLCAFAASAVRCTLHTFDCVWLCDFSRVANELLALQVMTLLLSQPTDDSVEVAISFVKECGQFLMEVSPTVRSSMH